MPGEYVWSLGAGGWVVRADGAVLLVRMTYGPAKDRLMIPGGHAEPGEFIHTAAMREVREETGLETVSRGLLLVRQRLEPHDRNLFFVFWLQPVGGVEQPELHEVSELVWLQPADILARDDAQPIAAELAAAWLNTPGHSLAARELEWQNPRGYRLWSGRPDQPPSGT